eukprot:jgi/Botrbrau1/14295/Bobra.0369s0009.1
MRNRLLGLVASVHLLTPSNYLVARETVRHSPVTVLHFSGVLFALWRVLEPRLQQVPPLTWTPDGPRSQPRALAQISTAYSVCNCPVVFLLCRTLRFRLQSYFSFILTTVIGGSR